MQEKIRRMAQEMAEKLAEQSADAGEQAGKTVQNALRTLYQKHPELAGKVVFGDVMLPGESAGNTHTNRDTSAPAAAPASGAENDRYMCADFDTRDMGDDDFWVMPAPKQSAYRPPSLQEHSLDTVPVESPGSGTVHAAEPVTEAIPRRFVEKARPAQDRFTRPADRVYPPKTTEKPAEDPFPASAPSERGPEAHFTDADFADAVPKTGSSAGEILEERDGTGALLRHITVRSWVNDFVFYGRFARDAQRSHRQSGDIANLMRFVPFTSYLPQYSQMSRNQLLYYLAFRDRVRAGEYPVFPGAGTAYIMLYAYEIINLPNEVKPADGMRLLCGLWRNYRSMDPRIDTFFGEWVPDYAMIHNVPLDPVIYPCLPAIVKKAQFKEFYLDTLLGSDNALPLLTDIFIEGFSDYDYTTSRYYRMHPHAYDQTMHEVLQRVLTEAYRTGREPFSLSREYRINRDAYAGAIAQTGVKMRLAITFTSFLRSEKPRIWVTGVLKYTENRLRKRLSLRSKLRVDGLSPADQSVIDAYFGADPVREKKTTAAEAEEETYLRYYESDSHGFDFSAAGAIESASWDNTARLTVPENAGNPVTDIAPAAEDESIVLPGEITDTEDIPRENPPASEVEPPASEETAAGTDMYAVEKAALAAALNGQFCAYCRSAGAFPGRMAERINEIFMEETGDIVLTEDPSSHSGAEYAVIEEYRMEAEEWSKS